MFRLVRMAVLVGIGFGIWYFFTHFRVLGLEGLRVQPRSQAATSEAGTSPRPSAQPLGKKTIRIAAANFGPLDQAKLGKKPVLGHFVHILRQFDIIALQDIQARDRSLVVQLLEQANAGGRHYDFAVAPEVGREAATRQYNAFVFDEDTIEIDRRTVAWVSNRDNQFAHPPLVAAFRARGPGLREAFTFTLINVQTSSERTSEELALLANVFRAVRDDGRNEDDVILLGTLGTDEEHLGSLALLPNACCAIAATPTTTRGIRAADNILFDRRATCEYAHRSGVLDLSREYNLSAREAAEIAEHLPVWAEFSVYEGGHPGQVASR